MSYERGWAALNLQPTDRVPRTEYIFHRGLINKLTGVDIDRPKPGEDAWWAISKALDFDFIWNTFPLPGADERMTNMGTAQWLETQTVTDDRSCAFSDVESVLSFDPVERIPVPTVAEMAVRFQEQWHERQQHYAHCVFPGGYYNTVFTWPILTFGWELFLTAAALEPERFDGVLDGFCAVSAVAFEAQASTDIDVFLIHDDIAWAQGPVFHPDWYRRHIFPRYRRLFQPLFEAGKIVLFCSDGNFTPFVDDLAELGVHGFIFEPATSLEYIVERYGRTHVMMGNVDCRILMSGSHQEIEDEVLRCLRIGRECPGYFMAVGNQIPYNIPLENVELYLELSSKHARR
jgi:hypothetical protein